ncbi:hypothetical protein N9L68_08710 [bacterium]|nr:hypothetical protein [bacterium]
MSGLKSVREIESVGEHSVPRAQLPRLPRQGLFMADSFPSIELAGRLAPDSPAEVWGGSRR